MTHSYTIKGLTCNNCVATVKSKLLMHPDIESADVTLADKAVIKMKRHIDLSELQQTIGNGKYVISSDPEDHTQTANSMDGQDEWWITYKPLLIIAGFITTLSALTADGNLSVGMTHFMAAFFLTFSFFKLLNLKGFAASYTMYDVVAKKIPTYGYLYPFIELGLGLLYLKGYSPVFTNWATIIVMGVSSIGVIQSLLRKQTIQCACLGTVFNLPMSTITIIEDLLMVVMAGVALLFS